MRNQRGYIMLLAIFFIIAIGGVSTAIVKMFSSQSRVSVAEFEGLKSFYVAESGFEATMRFLTSDNLGFSPERIRCADVTGNPNLTAVNITGGQFSATAAAPNFAITSLLSPISASDTSIPVADASVLAPRGRIVIDREYIDYAGISGNNLVDLTRGADGTRAATHLINVGVGQYQCSVNISSGVPNISNAKYERKLSAALQLQEGWLVGSSIGPDFGIYQLTEATGLYWVSQLLNLGFNAPTLNDIDATSYSDAWAVGDVHNGDHTILHWNGSAWSSTPTNASCSSQDLNSISVVSSHEAWAVGNDRPMWFCFFGPRRYTLLHYDGSSWSQLSSGSSPGIPSDSWSGRDLNAVHVIDTNGNGYGNIGFAVGQGGILLRYNGSNWVSDVSGTSDDLNGVYVVSSAEAWAVGENGRLLRWNGVSWGTYTSPTGNDLNAVSMLDTTGDGFANFGVAVGSNGRIITYDGTTWVSTSSGSDDLYAVDVINTHDVWASGEDGRLTHWDGTTWNSSSSSGTLHGLSFIGPRTQTVFGWQQTYS